jgi:hypothetical protein
MAKRSSNPQPFRIFAPMNSEIPSHLPQPGDNYEVPAEGSLALLALGAKGLIAWRKKRAAVMAQQTKNTPGGDAQKNG